MCAKNKIEYDSIVCQTELELDVLNHPRKIHVIVNLASIEKRKKNTIGFEHLEAFTSPQPDIRYDSQASAAE